MKTTLDGAWGLRFPDIAADQVLVSAPQWPRIRLTTHISGQPEAPVESRWDAQGASMALPAGGSVLLTWPLEVELSLCRAPSSECLIQPHLSTAAGSIALQQGRQPFHAGAFVVDGGAWGILGAREAGKSSTLALCHRAGLTVLTDDLLVVDHGAALVGPRCIDLRPDAAEQLKMGTDLGTVGRRPRWRVYLGPCSVSYPLRGWIVPSWGDNTISAVAPVKRLPVLAAHSFIQGTPLNVPSRYLDLAALPVLAWSRPRDWAMAETTASRLIDHLRTY